MAISDLPGAGFPPIPDQNETPAIPPEAPDRGFAQVPVVHLSREHGLTVLRTASSRPSISGDQVRRHNAQCR